MIHESRHKATDSQPRSIPSSMTERRFRAPESSSVGMLRQRLGNQGVQRLIGGKVGHTNGSTQSSQAVQANLTVSEPGDIYEREADRTANAVMRMPDSSVGDAPALNSGTTPAVQRMCTGCNDELEKKPEATVQRKEEAGGAPSGTRDVARNIDSLRGGGSELPAPTRAFFEPRFGANFSQVRVHTDTHAAGTASSINAKAFTVGLDIAFGAGQYAPDTRSGRHLLAHELTHVVQQSSGRVPQEIDAGRGDPLEREADQAAARALTGRAPVSRAPAAPRSYGSVARIHRKEAVQEGPNWLRHKGRWGAIDSPATLRLWAKEASMKMLWLGSTVRKIQEDPKSAEQLVDSVEPKLRRALYSPDEFTGSPAARRDAVEAFEMQWESGQLRKPILESLTEKYQGQLMQALAHTPEGSTLVTAPDDYVRVRHSPYLQEFWNHGEVMKKGYTSGNREVLDIKSYGPVGKPSTDPNAEIWYILKRDWSWIYHTTGKIRPYDWYIGRFAGEVANNTKFAAELFPLMLKIGGFALGFSSRLSVIIASEILTALGEQGTRSARGEKMQSAFEVAAGVGLGVFIGGVTNRMFSKAELRFEGKFDDAAEQASRKGRAELARTDAANVESKVAAGELKSVTDPGLLAEGYRLEVKIVSEGEEHVWRQQRNGWWCRFSKNKVCVAEISGTVTAVAKTYRAGQRVLSQLPVYKPMETIVNNGRRALQEAAPIYSGYLDNLMVRIRRLEEAMDDARRQGILNPELDPAFGPAFAKLNYEADAVYRRFVMNDRSRRLPAVDVIDEAVAARGGNLIDNPEIYDYLAGVEKMTAGTKYHDHVKRRVVEAFPEGTIFTEDTIKAFLKKEGIDPSIVIVSKKRGIDLYAFDRRRNLLTPVDITHVAGHPKHVGKLHRDVNKLETGLTREPIKSTEAFEIEYAGMTFDQAAANIIAELRPYAR
jgi:hypothetical protein